MDLHSGHPYWLLKNGMPCVYPTLKHDETCDVAIIGSGITGALIAQRLARENVDVVLIDKREVVTGSTVACTGLLQYEIDTELSELSKRIGDANARRCYHLGLQAIEEDRELVGLLDDPSDFSPQQSLYLARKRSHVARLRSECDCRAAAGLPHDRNRWCGRLP